MYRFNLPHVVETSLPLMTHLYKTYVKRHFEVLTRNECLLRCTRNQT